MKTKREWLFSLDEDTGELLHAASAERTAMFVGEAWEETKNEKGYFYLPNPGL